MHVPKTCLISTHHQLTRVAIHLMWQPFTTQPTAQLCKHLCSSYGKGSLVLWADECCAFKKGCCVCPCRAFPRLVKGRLLLLLLSWRLLLLPLRVPLLTAMVASKMCSQKRVLR